MTWKDIADRVFSEYCRLYYADDYGYVKCITSGVNAVKNNADSKQLFWSCFAGFLAGSIAGVGSGLGTYCLIIGGGLSILGLLAASSSGFSSGIILETSNQLIFERSIFV